MKIEDHADPVPLFDATLSALLGAVCLPHNDRTALTPGIVHIGLGHFHRAHQACYLHRLMQAGKPTAGPLSVQVCVRGTRTCAKDCWPRTA